MIKVFIFLVIFEVLRVVAMKIGLFQDVTSCRMIHHVITP